MDVLLEDGILLNSLELGLEVLQACGIAAAVRSAASVGHGEAFILDFFSVDTPAEVKSALVILVDDRERVSMNGDDLPSTLTGTVLFDLVGIGIDVSGLGEVSRKVVGGNGGAICNCSVVTVIEFVCLAHCQLETH